MALTEAAELYLDELLARDPVLREAFEHGRQMGLANPLPCKCETCVAWSCDCPCHEDGVG